MSKQGIQTSFIIVAVALPAEDIAVLVSRGLVVARLSEESQEEVLTSFGVVDWKTGTGLIGSLRDDELSPEEFTSQVLESYQPRTIESNPESLEVFSSSTGADDFVPVILKIEIFGVTESEALQDQLLDQGFSNIHYTEFGCIARRGQGEDVN